MKLVVFSICKDEANTIGKVLDQIPQKINGIDQIVKWVISDGSSDDTANIARKHGAQVYEGVTQKRLAYRFQQALDIVLSEKADIAVNIDGDLQFNPKDIPQLVEPVINGEYDFVAADRFTDPKTGQRKKPANMPANKYWANRLGAWIVGQLSQQRFRDVTCGFRAYNRKAMLALNLNGKYTYTQESFQQLASKQINIKCLPIKVTYYKDRKSRVVTSFSRFLFSSALNILRAFRDFAPLRFFGLLGLVGLIIGLVLLVFLSVYWLQTGQFTPYKSVGLAGLYFISAALVLWVLGLVADMLHRMINNQEKIILLLKEDKYSKIK